MCLCTMRESCDWCNPTSVEQRKKIDEKDEKIKNLREQIKAHREMLMAARNILLSQEAQVAIDEFLAAPWGLFDEAEKRTK